MHRPEYEDDYGTCDETYSTLRIYHDSLPPTDVTGRLGVEPDEMLFKGKIPPKRKRPAQINGWFLCSESHVKSFDSRRHIDWIIDQLDSKGPCLSEMMESGYRIEISSYWGSKSGHGGPTISPYQMERLSNLGIEVSWDVYFHAEDEDESGY